MKLTNPPPLEVRLSRLPCLLIGGVCFLFVIAGLDLLFFHSVLDFEIAPENTLPYYGFLLACFLVGGAGLVQMLWYLATPPVLLRIDERGISFATGMRYTPYFIEGRFVKGAGYGLSVDMTSHLNWFLLVKIELQQAAELPLALITSIGIKYEYYSVYLPWFYRNRSGSKIIETVNNFLASGVW